MQLDQILALGAELLCAENVAVTRRQRAATARDIETVESSEAEAAVQEIVRRVLQPAVGTSDDQCMRPSWSPLSVAVANHGVR
jgi:hypothetical protein